MKIKINKSINEISGPAQVGTPTPTTQANTPLKGPSSVPTAQATPSVTPSENNLNTSITKINSLDTLLFMLILLKVIL